MKPVLKLAALGCAGLLAPALVPQPRPPHPSRQPDTAHPVFVQTDNPAGNTIVAYDRTITGGLTPRGQLHHGRSWRDRNPR